MDSVGRRPVGPLTGVLVGHLVCSADFRVWDW